MTNKEMLMIAQKQSAIDANCSIDDFYGNKNKVVISKENPDARKYLALPHYCDLTSYGDNIVASVNVEIAEAVQRYIDKYLIEHCFETPNLHVLNEELKKKGYQVCFMAEYFLPDINLLSALKCHYQLKILYPEDFKNLYLPEWSNALCEARKNLDTLAVAAYDEDTLIGLSGCSTDCETMWQIGVDVLPRYRKNGIASALTSRLAIEILKQDKVPFYCCAWSNIKSARNAIASGFRPAWVQLTAKSIEFVDKMNMVIS